MSDGPITFRAGSQEEEGLEQLAEDRGVSMNKAASQACYNGLKEMGYLSGPTTTAGRVMSFLSNMLLLSAVLCLIFAFAVDLSLLAPGAFLAVFSLGLDRLERMEPELTFRYQALTKEGENA
ncbi:MAG: hypothetical protein HQRvContig01_52 [Haloquadratum phage sp.]|nr:MAG: hypothetical protein HQRvContig01_52 [Haloquadratum phage sp.]